MTLQFIKKPFQAAWMGSPSAIPSIPDWYGRPIRCMHQDKIKYIGRKRMNIKDYETLMWEAAKNTDGEWKLIFNMDSRIVQ